MIRFSCILTALLASSIAIAAESNIAPPPGGEEIVSKYVSAVRAQRERSEGVSMDVDMDGAIPRLHKEGRFHALRRISPLGLIRYVSSNFQGDDTIKKEVIGRYLQAELQSSKEAPGKLAIHPDNYKFRYKGTADYAGRPAHVFQVTPRKNKVGLYRGELWIDTDTYLPLREWGEMSKTPSVFLKDIYFVRDYSLYRGYALPRRLISDVNTRVVGKARLTIWFDNFKVGEENASLPELWAGQALGGAPSAQPR